MKNVIIFKFLPLELIRLINYHLQALIIQKIFKLNRPLTEFQIGDRVIINYNSSIIFKKIYGTIITIYDNICKIKLLPRLIPNWKKCNINFWKRYEHLLEDFNFPYYNSRILKVNKKNIFKLNPWKISNIDTIDSSKRIEIYFNYNKNIKLNNDILYNVNTTTTKSNIFGYYF